MKDGKPGLAIMIAEKLGKGRGKNEGDDEGGDDRYEEMASDLVEAVKSGDTETVAEILRMIAG